MKIRWALYAGALAFALALTGCSDDRSTNLSTDRELAGKGGDGPTPSGSACITQLQLAVIGTVGYDAIENSTQCEDDLYYQTVNGQVSVCRLFLKFDDDSKTYNWEDKRQSGWSGCSHYANLSQADAFLMYDSIDRVLTAMDSAAIYDRCFVFNDPVTGETLYTIYYDDPSDPSGSTVRRILTLKITPNTTCN